MPVQQKRLLPVAFSLRTMLIVTTIVAVVGGRWLITARNQRDTLDRLRKSCAADWLMLEIETDGIQKWFNHAPDANTSVVNHLLSSVSTVEISSNSNGWHLSTESVECLTRLPGLKNLRLSEVAMPQPLGPRSEIDFVLFLSTRSMIGSI